MNNTDEDPSLRIESSAIINLRGVSTKLNKYIVFTMQTYKELIEVLTTSLRTYKLRESGAENKVVKNPAKEIQHGLCFIKLG